MSNPQLIAEFDQHHSAARDWFAGAAKNAPSSLVELIEALAADDPNEMLRLSPELINCVRRLALLKMHELYLEYDTETG